MSFRTKIFLSITATVVIAVWIVAGVVSTLVSRSFERRDAERTATLVAQFRREFDRQGNEVARRLDAVANSDPVARMAVDLGSPQPDPGKYYDQAQTLAHEQSLDFLELVGPDGSIISSAEWPARFGYKEDWLLQSGDSKSIFLKREELADGAALGLITVRTVKVGERTVVYRRRAEIGQRISGLGCQRWRACECSSTAISNLWSRPSRLVRSWRPHWCGTSSGNLAS